MTEGKQRHGCLTAYLIFMIVVNLLVCFMYTFMQANIKQSMYVPDWALWAMAGLALLNVIAAIALLRWKKWGFYAFVVSAIVAFGINLSIGVGIVPSLLGFVGVAVVFGVLQIGSQNKGWPQLD